MVRDEISLNGGMRQKEATMYVGVLHTITNKTVWAEKLAEFEQSSPPDGYTNPITYIGANTDYAFCLWDVPSVEALQPMLDGLTQGGATNLYFPVDAEAFGTAGIPSQRIDLDTETPVNR
jgi:hypothetical protein